MGTWNYLNFKVFTHFLPFWFFFSNKSSKNFHKGLADIWLFIGKPIETSAAMQWKLISAIKIRKKWHCEGKKIHLDKFPLYEGKFSLATFNNISKHFNDTSAIKIIKVGQISCLALMSSTFCAICRKYPMLADWQSGWKWSSKYVRESTSLKLWLWPTWATEEHNRLEPGQISAG